jgi:DDE superfamily endonuclease
MLPGVSLPVSLTSLLAVFGGCFTAPTFATFAALVTGFVRQTAAHTVCGMLTGAGLERVWHHSRAHRFFSDARWSADALGLVLADLIVAHLVPPGAALTVAIDDTLLRRSGKKVFAASWCHDGSAKGPRKVAWGNNWVIAGLVVTLPFTTRPVCLPVLLRLWRPKGVTKLVLARQLTDTLAGRYPDRSIHVVADAAYATSELRGLPARVTVTSRLRRNAVLSDLAPPRTGRPGRPRLKGKRLGAPADLAAEARWDKVTVTRYGRHEQVWVSERRCLWHGALGCQQVRVVLVREAGRDHERGGYDLALVTTDLDSPAADIVARYACRWSIEVAIFDAKQTAGVGQARNRAPKAVERTVPFGFYCLTLVILWYALAGHTPEVVAERRRRAPWYASKKDPSVADMLATLRRVLIAAEFRPQHPKQPTYEESPPYAWPGHKPQHNRETLGFGMRAKRTGRGLLVTSSRSTPRRLRPRPWTGSSSSPKSGKAAIRRSSSCGTTPGQDLCRSSTSIRRSAR